jgi:hypothetical protein
MLSQLATKVESPEQMPTMGHFAILIFTSSTVHIPGDERSRTCPGHGYPAYDQTTKSYEYWVIRDPEALKTAIQKLESQKRDVSYKVIRVQPVEIETKIEVKIQG